MKKKIIAIILVALFIIDIVATALIFINIQVLTFPETTIRVDIVEINSDEVIIYHNLSLYNPNSFEMILEDFRIVAMTTAGEEVTNMTIDGGSVPGMSEKSFAGDDRIVMKGDLSELLSSTITGVVGFNLYGIIKKTIPLEVTVLISLKEALKKISIPTITVRAEFGTITRHDVNLTTEIDVTNPNPFGMFIDKFNLNITTENGSNVGKFMIPGSQIPAESSVTLKGYGTVVIGALNAKKLLITLHAEAGANIAGINKSLPISSNIEIAIPDLNEFIPTDKPVELSLDIDLKRARGGLNGSMTLEVLNPTKIPLIASDIVVWYYVVKDGQKYFVGKGPLGTGELVPENTTYFYGSILLLYSKLLNTPGRGLLPDAVFAQLRANITLSGVNLFLPVAIGSYIDLHMFRASE
jgi:LEA14-like dessication related protein